VLTFDLDFSAILSSTRELKPSVVQIRVSIPYAEQAVDLISAAMFKNYEDLERGAILTIDANKARLRLLPL
jgi:predicted nuclease of predicted toxin-antitoxin system